MSPAEVFAQASPGVVQVFSLGVNQFRVIDRIQASQGSGVVFGGNLVVTNFHVIFGADSVVVTVGERLIEAQIVGIDPILDVAVLRVPGLDFFAEALELAPTDAIVVGQPAYVLGFPLGIGKSMSSGIVSGLARKIPLNTSSWLSPFIQTDAAISAGNSGGPLLDGCAQVIGLVTLHVETPESEDIGFAIPAATLRLLLPELIETGKVARPWHGLYGQMVTPQAFHLLGVPLELWTDGFMVETVEPGSAADRAGLHGGNLPVRWGMQEILLGGDIITEVQGQTLRSIDDAVSVVRSLQIGQMVTIKVLRGGQELKKSVTIEERPVLERDLERYRQP